MYSDVSGAGPLVARACAPVCPSMATPLTIYLYHIGSTCIVAEISHAGYLVENLKPPGPSELGLEGRLDVKKFYLPGKLHGQDK